MVGECGVGGPGRTAGTQHACGLQTHKPHQAEIRHTLTQLKGRRELYLTYPGCLKTALSLSPPEKCIPPGTCFSLFLPKGREMVLAGTPTHGVT